MRRDFACSRLPLLSRASIIPSGSPRKFRLGRSSRHSDINSSVSVPRCFSAVDNSEREREREREKQLSARSGRRCAAATNRRALPVPVPATAFSRMGKADLCRNASTLFLCTRHRHPPRQPQSPHPLPWPLPTQAPNLPPSIPWLHPAHHAPFHPRVYRTAASGLLHGL